MFCYFSCNIFDAIYRHLFHWDIQTLRRELKIDAQQSIFDEIQGPWIACETLSQVFDIYLLDWNKDLGVNKEINQVWSKSRMLIKTWYPNFLHSCDFLFF